MKIKIIIILAFFTSKNIIYAQVKEYYSLVNEAEFFIVQNNLKQADNKYKEAFKLKVDYKIVDVVNSLKCSCILNDALPSNLINVLEEKNVSNKLIRKDKVLKKCFKARNIMLDHTKANIDDNYIILIKNIVEKDQAIRHKPNAYVKYRKEMDSIDNENFIEFIALIDKFGFPSESKVGLGDNLGGRLNWEILMIHLFQHASKMNSSLKPETYSKMRAILDKALKSNDITPTKFVYFLELEKNNVFYENWVLSKLDNNQWGLSHSILEKMDEIDIVRKQIGLCTIREHIKKTYFENNKKLNPNHFYFKSDEPYMYTLNASAEVKKLYKNGSIIINENF
jgi:hypothetical protein